MPASGCCGLGCPAPWRPRLPADVASHRDASLSSSCSFARSSALAVSACILKVGHAPLFCLASPRLVLAVRPRMLPLTAR